MAEETGQKEYKDWLDAKILQKAVVLDNEGNILIIRRISIGLAARPDKWDLPGGSVGNEDLERVGTDVLTEAIAREVKEETGLIITGVEYVYHNPWVFEKASGKKLGIAFGYKCLITGVKPEVVLSPEHYEYKWCSKDEALNFDFGDDGGLHKNIIKNV